ncbi:DUF4440 domain-containing protein [Marinobacter xestospongiae]|uniref:DUF4440 domain-containing protein n=1 Tax=Marinobacter xestospongiae TaxID=994319 RepID=A0ABU3W379_9GAMM|nr:DUF4440 domain-containing protein [Marinobacter xestospongiae]MDV2080988.1 DUF4440 domain-containing protein [Marinobacter xestospongiae]
MPSTKQSLIYRQHVIDLHHWIATVFSGSGPEVESAHADLLASFHPTFTMVTTAGDLVGLEQVKDLFRRNQGLRPGMEIEIADCEIIQTSGSMVAVRYRETQRTGSEQNTRLSIALLEHTSNGVVWRYLHETAIEDRQP